MKVAFKQNQGVGSLTKSVRRQTVTGCLEGKSVPGDPTLKPGFIGVMDQLCNWLDSSLCFKLGFKQGC